jgi:hypothetical protein
MKRFVTLSLLFLVLALFTTACSPLRISSQRSTEIITDASSPEDAVRQLEAQRRHIPPEEVPVHAVRSTAADSIVFYDLPQPGKIEPRTGQQASGLCYARPTQQEAAWKLSIWETLCFSIMEPLPVQLVTCTVAWDSTVHGWFIFGRRDRSNVQSIEFQSQWNTVYRDELSNGFFLLRLIEGEGQRGTLRLLGQDGKVLQQAAPDTICSRIRIHKA